MRKNVLKNGISIITFKKKVVQIFLSIKAKIIGRGDKNSSQDQSISNFQPLLESQPVVNQETQSILLMPHKFMSIHSILIRVELHFECAKTRLYRIEPVAVLSRIKGRNRRYYFNEWGRKIRREAPFPI